MSSYSADTPEQLDGFIWNSTSDRSKFISILAGQSTVSKSEWGNVYDTLLPLYREWVGTAQIPVYVPYTASADATVKKLTVKSGLMEKNVKLFLDSLAAGVKTNQLPSVMLDPGLPGQIKENIASRGVESVENALARTTTVIGQSAGNLIKPVIFGAVVIALIIYSPQIMKGLKAAGKAGSAVREKIKSTGAKIRSKFA